MLDSPSVQFDDHRDVPRPEEQVLNDGEVTAPNATGVMLQVAQVWLEFRRTLGMCFRIVQLLPRPPSFSNSPRMRSARHYRFSLGIFLMRTGVQEALGSFLFLFVELCRP